MKYMDRNIHIYFYNISILCYIHSYFIFQFTYLNYRLFIYLYNIQGYIYFYNFNSWASDYIFTYLDISNRTALKAVINYYALVCSKNSKEKILFIVNIPVTPSKAVLKDYCCHAKSLMKRSTIVFFPVCLNSAKNFKNDLDQLNTASKTSSSGFSLFFHCCSYPKHKCWVNSFERSLNADVRIPRIWLYSFTYSTKRNPWRVRSP